MPHLNHPKGYQPPWANGSHITTAELLDWWASGDSKKQQGKWKGKAGIRADLGHNCRSQPEADWARWLKYNGYRRWSEKGDPPEGKWYRYEGRTFPFGDLRGKNWAYKTDFELWPGYFDSLRPYELHEIKGWLDSDSKTKLNRMKQYYADVPLELVTVEIFSQHTKGAAKIVPRWGA